MTIVKDINIAMHRPHLRDVPELYPLPQDYRLQLLTRRDEPQLAVLLSLAFAEPWNVRRVQSMLTRVEAIKAVYGVFWQGELVATASSQYLPERDWRVGFVHWVATHPLHRGKGLAAKLLERLLWDFEARGYSGARLFTQPERLAAIRNYLKFGFVPEYLFDGRNDKSVWSSIFQVLATHR